jgi:hypothetical protein
MFKRNGQLCEHTVPDYSGRLTDAEFLAYNSVFSAVEEDFKELSKVASALGEVEKSFAQFVDAASASRETPPEIIGLQGGAEWEVLKPLLNVRGGEMLWCKGRVEGADEFAIVERIDANSPLAMAQGACSVQMTGKDAQALLRDFLHEQREALGLYANDIVAEAHERIAEKYPGQDMDRVVKAVEARCAKKISSEQMTAQTQARGRREGMRV